MSSKHVPYHHTSTVSTFTVYVLHVFHYIQNSTFMVVRNSAEVVGALRRGAVLDHPLHAQGAPRGPPLAALRPPRDRASRHPRQKLCAQGVEQGWSARACTGSNQSLPNPQGGHKTTKQ